MRRKREKKAEPTLPLYYIEAEPQSRLAEIWRVILLMLTDKLESAKIDAYPSPDWIGFEELPPEAQEAQRILAKRARQVASKSSDPLMVIPLHLNDEGERELVQTFAPYSISAEILDSDNNAVGGLSDGGTSNWIHLAEEERRELGIALSDIGIDADQVLKLAPAKYQ